jgi:hypothetical protein
MMATVTICDGCGEPIDTKQPYYTGSVQTVQVTEETGLTTVAEARPFDFHTEHFPIDLDASDTGAIVPPAGEPVDG